MSKARQKDALFDDDALDDNEQLIDIDDFFCPPIGDDDEIYYDSYIDSDMLKRGEKETMEFRNTLKKHITSDLYYAMRDESLLEDDAPIPASLKIKTSKKMYLQIRYSKNSDGDLIETKTNKLLCEPKYIYKLTMKAHFMNNHMRSNKLYRNLSMKYCNIPNLLVVLVLQYCSHCNTTGKIRDIRSNYGQRNQYIDYLPLERLQIDITKPFNDSDIKIANKYSHILLIRDYHSRYSWIFPLKSPNIKNISTELGKFLVTLPRTPIFLHSIGIPESQLIKILTKILLEYKIKIRIGIGGIKGRMFLRKGISRLVYLLNLKENKEKCKSDWYQCIRNTTFKENRRFDRNTGSFANFLIGKQKAELNKVFENKRDALLSDLLEENVLKIGECGSIIYFDNNNSGKELDEKDVNGGVNENSEEESDYENDDDDDESFYTGVKKRKKARVN
ncbi:hypothetical protein TBLA_0F03070 [Henningerozyma blattae CBS 6284]|uniref:Uncharacterized protein n=1 Tax=Henningerozyma blattae (strain ATCC 34711 / CBS 6284 / DSM 70876 / NBRC 10599 / NRRL Y-10934 / UCD 77-7) TaxID=1071380 RepID=I2H644_HENB6|nr:hypothetical protein TBLA_0F03070 [Tetrapisispora blattae CBS 6284]CCH61846.1 hypothetical protein TBLA_0F03070 [Tetrapisispora blattae CBS 6284]